MACVQSQPRPSITAPSSLASSASSSSSPTSSSSPVSASGRPKRSVSIGVNYAEAVEDTPMRGGGSGGSRKRQASQSPAKRVRTPKSLIKQIQAAALANKQNQQADTDADTDEDDDGEVKKKTKPASLNFGVSKKKTVRPSDSPKYVTRFVISCEQICSRSPELLAAWHKEMMKLLPLNPADVEKIRAAMERVLTKRVVERIEAQMRRLGDHGAPSDGYLHKSARTPLMSTCSKCRTAASFLVTICSECKCHKAGALELNPYVDWREAVLKQAELDADEAANPTAKETAGSASAKKKAGVKASPERTKQEAGGDAAMEDVKSEDDVQATPNKRAKTSTIASASSSPTTTTTTAAGVAATPSKSKSLSLASIPHPDAAWILAAREAITLRAIEWLRVAMSKAKTHEFNFHGGDIIFLLRNAIFKGRGAVAREADRAVREMIARWDAGTLTIISDSSEPAHILVYSECLHAKQEMACGTPDEIAVLANRVRSALTNHCAEDILRFDASLYQHSLPSAAYCHPCGMFHASAGKSGGVCPECSTALRQEPDFEFLCESLVWTSLFRELGIDPVQTADASVSLADILALMKYIRPYGSLEERGADSFKLQCYFITHLTFIMTRWGAVAMTPRTLFVEEYLFLLANMDVVIRIKDPELVGEFLQALHILDTPHTHPAMQKGYHFLLTHEKKGKMRGNWMTASDEFYKKYHTAYCGIIGMAAFEFDANRKFNTEWDHFFQ